MPELPEVASFRKQLEETSLHRRIAGARVLNEKILAGISGEELEKALQGRAFLSARQHGKNLFAQMDDGRWLAMHFGMSGYLQYFEKMQEEPRYGRLIVMFEGGSRLAFMEPRMLGKVRLIEDMAGFVANRGLGLSALEERFDLAAFRKALSRRKGEIKPVLTNQSVVSGIGNLYSDEILFQAGIHPRTRVPALSGKRLANLFHNIKRVLRTAVERDADFDSYPDDFLLRNRRKGALCPKCGTQLAQTKFAGRYSYFCPSCQRL